MLDFSKLHNLQKNPDGSHQSQCPACAAKGSDKTGNHLRIFTDGRFGCALFPKNRTHRREVLRLAGDGGNEGQSNPAKFRPCQPIKIRPWRTSDSTKN